MSGTSGAQTFTVSNPLPTLASINPTSGSAGSTFDIVLTGGNFIQGVSSVDFSSTQQLTVNSTTVDSPTQITVNITLGGGANAGTRNISVTNAAPGGGTSATRPFTVN